MAGLRFRCYGANLDPAGPIGDASLAKSASKFGFGDVRAGWLEAFVLTVDNKKRTAAAAQLEVSEDTVTKNIEKLEKWLGGGQRRLLMVPNMYPVVLTDEGRRFLPDARQILELMREARKLPVVTDAPIKRVSSTAHLTVPPPVASVPDGERDDH